MDWNNVNLKDNYQRSQNILDPYNFDTLLLEISTNLRNIDEENVKRQFEKSLLNKIRSAREVFKANLDSIVKEAQEYRDLE